MEEREKITWFTSLNLVEFTFDKSENMDSYNEMRELFISTHREREIICTLPRTWVDKDCSIDLSMLATWAEITGSFTFNAREQSWSHFSFKSALLERSVKSIYIHRLEYTHIYNSSNYIKYIQCIYYIYNIYIIN